MVMEITSIWMSQRNLRCAEQIPAMVEAIRDGAYLPRIELSRDEDGSIQLEDGHHRLIAYWLSGRRELNPHEFFLTEKDQCRPRRGKIKQLLKVTQVEL